MKLSELRSELTGWAALFGREYDPEVFVRVGSQKTAMICMEVGDSSNNEGITLGSWSQLWQLDTPTGAASTPDLYSDVE